MAATPRRRYVQYIDGKLVPVAAIELVQALEHHGGRQMKRAVMILALCQP